MTACDDWIQSHIRAVPDFPEPGIVFRDLTPLMADADALRYSVEALADEFVGAGATHVVGIDARGFIFGAAVATRLGAGFVPIRKGGKLPPPVHGIEYDLEYGSATLELAGHCLDADARVVIIDDVLATGGTVEATLELIKRAGSEVLGAGFVVEIAPLNGRSRMPHIEPFSLVTYD